MASSNVAPPGPPPAERTGTPAIPLDTIVLHVLSPSAEVNGGRITFPSIALDTNISHLKSRIQTSMIVPAPPERQRLIYRGRPLLNMETTLGQILQSEVSLLQPPPTQQGTNSETAECFHRREPDVHFSSGDLTRAWLNASCSFICISEQCSATPVNTTSRIAGSTIPRHFSPSSPRPSATCSVTRASRDGASSGGTSYVTKPIEPASTADRNDKYDSSRPCSRPRAHTQSATFNTAVSIRSADHASISGCNYATAADAGSCGNARNSQSAHERNTFWNAIRSKRSSTNGTHHY